MVDAETDPEEMSHVGDEYEDITPTLEAAFTRHTQVQVETEFATDKWGTWLSSFAPILRADGSLEAVDGLDVSASTIVQYERRYLTIIMVICHRNFVGNHCRFVFCAANESAAGGTSYRYGQNSKARFKR